MIAPDTNNAITGYHTRRSFQLSGFDYARPGHYFMTVWQRNYCEHVLRDEKAMNAQ
jgi:hypothetical protein